MFSSVQDHVAAAVKQYRVDLETLPDYWAGEACNEFRTGLNASFIQCNSHNHYMWGPAYKTATGEQDISDNDYGTDETDSGEEDELIPGGSERVSKRDLVRCALLQTMPQCRSQGDRGKSRRTLL
jgi:hypothetical protein